MSIKHDPVEKTKKYKEIEKELEEKIKAEIGDNMYLGRCHIYWKTKARILKDDYGIDWKSPAELNIGVMFD